MQELSAYPTRRSSDLHPKKEYKVKLKDEDKHFVLEKTESDLNKFDRLIDEIEPDGLRMPVLLKKYIKQNAKLVAFKDRKSTRLNSSHVAISYAVFCWK